MSLICTCTLSASHTCSSSRHLSATFKFRHSDSFELLCFLPPTPQVDWLMLGSVNQGLDDWECIVHRTVMFPVFLYGCETCCRTLKEEHRLRVFESMVLRRYLGVREEVTVDWGKLHKKDLQHLYFSQYFIWVIKLSRTRWAGYVACIEKRNTYGILVGKPEGRRSLGGPRHRWEDI